MTAPYTVDPPLGTNAGSSGPVIVPVLSIGRAPYPAAPQSWQLPTTKGITPFNTGNALFLFYNPPC